jgi:Fur family ferric uptake transcriptional regulator
VTVPEGPRGARDALRARIRAAGLRSTLARISVLRTVEEAPRPLSHAEVAKLLLDEGIDYATVYRNLTDLTEAGLLSRVDQGDHTWRFQAAGALEHRLEHPHFECSACGQVTCLPEETVAFHESRSAPTAVRRRAVAVHFKGVCDRCAKDSQDS